MENVLLWIAVIVLILLAIILLVKILTYPFTYFAKMDLSQVVAKELLIQAGDLELPACLYLPGYALHENKLLINVFTDN